MTIGCVSDLVLSRWSELNRQGYKEKRELEQLPAKIEQLEVDAAKLHGVMADGEFYKQPSDEIAARQAELKEIEQQLSQAYSRWEELEQLAS